MSNMIFIDYLKKNVEVAIEGSLEDFSKPPQIKFYYEKNKIRAFGREYIVFSKNLEMDFIKILEIYNYRYTLYKNSYIKIDWSEKSELLIAINSDGIQCLRVLEESFPEESTKSHLAYNLISYEVLRYFSSLNWPQTPKPRKFSLILEIPKLENVSKFNPIECSHIYRDIKEISNCVFIKDLKYENIKYLREYNKYIIVDFENCRLLDNEVKFSFKEFICNGTPYICNGRPISFEEYVFLEEVV